MQKINNFWTDENNNKWSCDFYTEQEAIARSATLINCINCRDCINCSYCRDCSYCSYCRDCSYCIACRGCSDCIDCSYCIACSDCSDCIDCSYCSYCRDCSYCRGCSDCIDCRGCINCSNCMENPMRYTTSKIGSREGNTTFYYDGKKLQVVCGCFRGNLEEFEKKVLETHGNNEVYREQYLKEIRKVKVLFELGWENK